MPSWLDYNINQYNQNLYYHRGWVRRQTSEKVWWPPHGGINFVVYTVEKRKSFQRQYIEGHLNHYSEQCLSQGERTLSDRRCLGAAGVQTREIIQKKSSISDWGMGNIESNIKTLDFVLLERTKWRIWALTEFFASLFHETHDLNFNNWKKWMHIIINWFTLFF